MEYHLTDEERMFAHCLNKDITAAVVNVLRVTGFPGYWNASQVGRSVLGVLVMLGLNAAKMRGLTVDEAIESATIALNSWKTFNSKEEVPSASSTDRTTN